MRGSNPVTGKWLSHILIHAIVLGIPKFVVVRKKVTCKLKRDTKTVLIVKQTKLKFLIFYLFWSEKGSFNVAAWISHEIPHEGSGFIGCHWCVALFCQKSLEVFQRYYASILGIFLEGRLVHL